jgi:predicted nucleic acid-binding Zn ribbon protein
MEEISKILPLIFKKQVRCSEPRVVDILAPLWPQVAGKPIAQHSKPVAFEQGTLTLESDCSTWCVQLRSMAGQIKAEINGYLGVSVVRKLQVRYVSKPIFLTPPVQKGAGVN